MKLILSFLIILSMSVSFADDGKKIKTINAYNKKYHDIEKLIDPLKKTVIIFSVSWCSPCKVIKKKLEENLDFNYSELQILYIITDQDNKGQRSEDGMSNPSFAKSLEDMGQGYWPFILLFEPGSKTAISKFPVIEGYTDYCPDKLFYDRIMGFIKDGSVCQEN